jgi:protein-disulfide isomerase/uncharacterized membrane protein
VAFALIALGGAASGSLLARHFNVNAGAAAPFDICRAVFGNACDDVVSSELAVQFGIPLAGWGLVHFSVVAVALALALGVGEGFRNVGTLAAIALCAIATVLGVALIAAMAVGGRLCPLCIVVHVANLFLIPVILMASARTPAEWRAAIAAGFDYVAGRDREDPTLARWQISGLVTLGLVGVVAYQWVLIQADRHAARTPSPVTLKQVLADLDKAQAYEFSIADDDPAIGDRTGRLQLVVFSDFQCPACRRAAQAIAHAREHHPELSVVFKHYPLSKACNPALRVDLHPLSCAAAYAAEAARRQGKFWEYHDALFEAGDPLDAGAIRNAASHVGLDLDRFDADIADEGTKAKVDADIALGKTLKVTGTPSIFLNKKLLSDQALALFDQVIDHQAAHLHD